MIIRKLRIENVKAFFNKDKNIQTAFSVELDYHICKESDAGIGLYFIKHNFESDLEYYGKFNFGLFFGRYLIDFTPKKLFKFCDFYATGVGG